MTADCSWGQNTVQFIEWARMQAKQKQPQTPKWVEEELMVDDADDYPAVGGFETSIDVRIDAGSKGRKSKHGSR
jgi:hypothetical protein